jgi:hypothetical protein
VITGVDRHPWAVDEARWTYRQLRLSGQAKQGDLTRVRLPGHRSGIVAAYTLNELSDELRGLTEQRLLDVAAAGARVLVLEPIARSITPWWDATAARVQAAGGRSDEWRIPVELPPMLRLFDHAAGLNHRELKLRTLYLPGR